MKNLFLLLICFVLTFQVGYAQGEIKTPMEKTVETASKFAPTEKENSLLWKISGKELKEDSYLYGTIHMIGKDDFFLTDETKVAFKTVKKVTFEINMEDMNDISMLFTLMSKVMMDNGTTLKDLVNDEDYTLINNHFKDLGLPMFMLEKIKPMFLSVMASSDMTGGGFQNGDIKSYEMEFMNMAKSSEKEMDGLETIEFQMSVFDSIPYKDQANMLVDAIKSGGEEDDTFKEMVEMYKKQDILAMQTMFAEDTEGVAKFEDIFLKNRNENWIPIMEKMSAAQATFFAVGAGHLGGENGVVALMRQAGYEMTPIFSKTEPRP